MKRKLLSLALSFALCLTLLPGAALAADETAPAYGGGSGTQDDPWIIATVEDITTLAATVNDGTYYEDAYFKQTADLDMTGVDWEPIGYSDNDDIYFCGNYDGDNHPVTAPDKADNGSVSVSPKNAIQGSAVTVKVTPDSGYVVDRVTVTDNRGNEVKLTQKGVGTYTFTMPAGQVTVTAAFAPAAEQSPFRDVSASDYYYAAVLWAYQKGVTQGVSASAFAPSAPCTRGQMAMFLYQLKG